MASSMGPPPPQPPSAADAASSSADPQPAPLAEPSTSSSSSSEIPSPTEPSMAPPPPKNPKSSPPRTSSSEKEMPKLDTDSARSPPPEDATKDAAPQKIERSRESRAQSLQAPYEIPAWSGPPCYSYSFEVLKDGSIIDQFDVSEKEAYMFGRVDLCDFVLDHPSISRFHAVIQFKENGDAYLYDLGSSHGSFINKKQVKKKVYIDLHVGDVIRFGLSSRLYIFQGPTDLMPAERDMSAVRYVKQQQEILDRNASLQRAREEAALADGISWGMGEDAVEEDEDDIDEITWQTFKGEFTEKQEKTRSKVLKRLEKIAHMKKEIDAIRAKDIAQGGLTQGQQTQIARNEQRIAQILEELESLEETLNDSIRESLGARAGKISHGKKKEAVEDDEDLSSDDDEFYDRTKKNKPVVNKSGDDKSVETAETLLDKKEAIMKDMEEKAKLLEDEKNKSPVVKVEEIGDALDAYMSGLSSQLKIDKTQQLTKEISSLQSDLDRILYLLKIADPAGESAKKRLATAQPPTSKDSDRTQSTVRTSKELPLKKNKSDKTKKPSSEPLEEKEAIVVTKKVESVSEASQDSCATKDDKSTSYTMVKPQWLGAITEEKDKIEPVEEVREDVEEGDQFVSYNDRSKILNNIDQTTIEGSGLENAATGLILRKKKPTEKKEDGQDLASKKSTASAQQGQMNADDAVALLLKHKRGYYHLDEEESQGTVFNQSKQDSKKPRRVLGPEKPSFLEGITDNDTWVPPKGQSGDGRTSLNDRLGY